MSSRDIATITEELADLRKYIQGLPEDLLKSGAFIAYQNRESLLLEELIAGIALRRSKTCYSSESTGSGWQQGMATSRRRPAVFIGSSREGHQIARAMQVLLDRSCEVEIWDQGIFGLGQGTLESLVLALGRFDFAILVLTADDLTIKRGESQSTARDNVVFELGLFTGGLGRDRTYMLFDRSNPPKLPADLAGITAATFEPHASGNLNAALGAASTQIESQIERLGVREQERFKGLTEAAANVQGVGSQMQQLIRLLARSRKVELDIISSQFGPLIASDKLKQISDDLQGLQGVLDAP